MTGLNTLDEWRARAIELMRSGRLGGPHVIEANAAILDLDRSNNAARTRLGFAYRLEGDFDSAEAVYRQILESTSPEVDHYRTAEKALPLIQRERLGLSKPYSLEDHLLAVRDSDDAYQRASALRDAAKPDLALRWVERGLDLANGQGKARLQRGLAVRASIWRRKDAPRKALDDARASVALGPITKRTDQLLLS